MRSKTNWISPPCSFLLLFTSSLLHSSIPCHSSSSHCSHTVDPNSFIQDSQASPWDTHHTPMPSITSKHGACSQALPHVLSHVDVLSVNTRRRFLEHACLQCSHQYQEVVDMGSVLPISGLLCVHPFWFLGTGLQVYLLLCQPARTREWFSMLETRSQYPPGTLGECPCAMN